MKRKKRKLLFIMESLHIGGAEKSLITILNLLDYTRYDVDLFLFDYKGEFFKMIPEEVNLLKESKKYKTFIRNRKLSPIIFLLKLDFKSFYHSLHWLFKTLISKLKSEKIYIGWDDISYFFNSIDKKYDTSIAFLERKTIYFNVDKVNAKNKVGFIHNDYSTYPYDDSLDRKYFKYYNYIATVSSHCKDVLIDIFPEYKKKFIVIKNMVSKELILKLAEEKIENYNIEKNYINIVSVGRLVYQKGFDIAIDICKKLKKENIKIKWYVIGDGEEKRKLKKKIKEKNLENTFYLVGADVNPYKWMNIADIYVQPSRFEGYGITVAEAKCLAKPIIASDIPEFRELLNDNKGLLCSTINDYILVIEEVICKKSLKNKLIKNLQDEKENFDELEKLYKICK